VFITIISPSREVSIIIIVIVITLARQTRKKVLLATLLLSFTSLAFARAVMNGTN
jgi:hypothetical protein